MLSALSRNWGLIALRGVLGIIFGVLAFVWPLSTLFALVLLWGIYALLDGGAAIAMSFGAKERGGKSWPLIVSGAIGILAGIAAFIWPGITAMALLFVIGVWLVAKGILEIVTAFRLRKEVKGEWLMALAGVLSVVAGVVMFANPGAGALALVWVIGFYAIFFGLLQIGLAFRLRSFKKRVVAPRMAPTTATPMPA